MAGSTAPAPAGTELSRPGWSPRLREAFAAASSRRARGDGYVKEPAGGQRTAGVGRTEAVRPWFIQYNTKW